MLKQALLSTLTVLAVLMFAGQASAAPPSTTPTTTAQGFDSALASTPWDKEWFRGDPRDFGFPAEGANCCSSAQWRFDEVNNTEVIGFMQSVGNGGTGFRSDTVGFTKASGWVFEWGFESLSATQPPPNHTPSGMTTFRDDESVLNFFMENGGTVRLDSTPVDGDASRTASFSLDFDAAHIYRLQRDPGSDTVELLVDGAMRASVLAPEAIGFDHNFMRFGDTFNEGFWDFVRLHDRSTIPEPATIGLLGLGGVALLRRRRA